VDDGQGREGGSAGKAKKKNKDYHCGGFAKRESLPGEIGRVSREA